MSPLKCLLTRYGADSYIALASAVRQAKNGDPLQPVTVVVPTHYVALAAPRIIASTTKSHEGHNGIAAVDFVIINDLAHRLGGRRIAILGKTIVFDAVIAAAVRTILRNNPGYFSGVASHPATEKALVAAHKELSEVSEKGLRVLSEQSTRTADVVRIHRAISEILYSHPYNSSHPDNSSQSTGNSSQSTGNSSYPDYSSHPDNTSQSTGIPNTEPRFCNTSRLLEQAVIALQDDPHVNEHLGPLIIFLPQRLTRGEIRLLHSVASTTPTTVIAGLTGCSDADTAVKSSLQHLGVDLGDNLSPPNQSNLADPDTTTSTHTPTWQTATTPPTETNPDTTTTSTHTPTWQTATTPPTETNPDTTTTSSHTENISALRQLLEGHEIKALSVSDPDDEIRHAIREVFSALRAGTRLGRCAIVYGSSVPYARSVGDALDAAGIKRCGTEAHTAATSWLGRTLLGLLNLHGDRFSRRRVLTWLDSTLRRPAPVAAWERIARAAQVGTGFENWDSRLQAFIRSCRSEAELIAHNPSSEESLRLAERCDNQADQAEKLLSFIRELHSDLHPEPAPLTWIGLAEWCRKLIRSYLDDKTDREGWPDHEGTLAGRVHEAIDRLSGLDGIDDHASPEQFRRALELELTGSRYTRGLFGTAVLVGSPSLTLGVELDLLVVCGMAEGVFPSRHHNDTLIPDRERRSAGNDLPSGSSRIGDEHREFLAALASAKRTLLLYPRGDLRQSADNSPSRWLLDIAEAKSPNNVRPSEDELPKTTGDWFREVPSFVAGLRDVDFPTSEQEYDTKSLFNWHTRNRKSHQSRTRHSNSGILQDRTSGRTDDSASGSTPDSASSIPPDSADGIPPDSASNIPPDRTNGILQHGVVASRTVLRRGFELTIARNSSRFTRFDGNLYTNGNLRDAVIPSPLQTDEPISASRLETWARCPYAYFVRYVLGVEPTDTKRDDYHISALDLGSAVHRVLEQWIKEALEADEIPEPHEPWPEKWCKRLVTIGEEQCDRLEAQGLNGREIYWTSSRKHLLADLFRFLELDNEMRSQHSSTPIAAELGFGLPGSEHASVDLVLTLETAPSGNSSSLNQHVNRVKIRGSIDRLDVTETGDSIVIDYKTGSDSRYRNLEKNDPSPGDGHIQLVLYAMAARKLIKLVDAGYITHTHTDHHTDADISTDHHTDAHTSTDHHTDARTSSQGNDNAGDDRCEYWFVSSKGGFQPMGYPVRIAEEQVLQMIATVVTGIDNKIFPQLPSKTGSQSRAVCDFCSPDGLSMRNVGYAWQRKYQDPVLNRYLNILCS